MEPAMNPPKQDKEAYAPAPRWVKVLGVITIVVLVVIVLIHLTAGGLGGLHH